MSPSCRAFCRSCTSALNHFVTHGMSLECLSTVVVGKCSSIRELSTDVKASNCSWHVERWYSEDQLMAVRSAANVRLVSVVTCCVVLIVCEHGRCFHVVPRQGMLTVAHRCRSYPCPGSIAMTGNSGDYVVITDLFLCCGLHAVPLFLQSGMILTTNCS